MSPRPAAILAIFFANALGITFAALIILLHQSRPELDVIRLYRAAFTTNDSVRPPDFAQARQVQVPDDWVDRHVEGNVGWYRFKLPLNVAPNSLWAVYIPALEMSPTVFINDIMLGGSDRAAPLPRYWQRPVMFSIANGVLQPGDNTIDIRVAANGQWGRLSELYLGRAEVIRASFEDRFFWRVTFLYATAAVSFAISMFMLTIFLIRRESRYGWFAAFSATLGAQNMFVLTVTLPVTNAVWDFLSYVLYGTLVVTGTLFTFRFLSVRHERAERYLLRAYGIGISLLLPLVWIDPAMLNRLGSLVWLSLVLICALYPIGSLMKRTWSNFDAEIFFLVAVYCTMISLGIYDWLVSTGFGYRHHGHLLQYATAPTLLIFGTILLRRFVAAIRDSEALYRDMEKRVAEKTRAFEDSYSLSQQLKADKILSNERERIMREVHDGVGGQLIGAIARLDQERPRERRLADDLQMALRDLRLTIDSLESVDGDLPTVLGLLRHRLQDQLDAAHIQLIWEVGDLPQVQNMGPERVLHVLRIAQEVITNAIMHSGCSTIRVTTRDTDVIDGQPCLTIEIADDGCGMRDNRTSGRGLKNMYYRAGQADLLLKITPQPGVTVRIAIRQNQSPV